MLLEELTLFDNDASDVFGNFQSLIWRDRLSKPLPEFESCPDGEATHRVGHQDLQPTDQVASPTERNSARWTGISEGIQRSVPDPS